MAMVVRSASRILSGGRQHFHARGARSVSASLLRVRSIHGARGFSPRIWLKLVAVAVSFIVPLALTTYFLVNESSIKINFAKQELRGDRYLRPLGQLLVDVTLHGAAVRRADTAAAENTETLVDTDFQRILDTDRELHNALKTTSEALNT